MKTSKNRGTYYSPFTIMADERTEKQKVQEITDKLEEGLKELFESEKPCRSRKRHLWQDTRHGRRILRDMSIKEKRFYASMDRKSWNSNLVIPLKHIIFTIPFIADGSVLMCFLD